MKYGVACRVVAAVVILLVGIQPALGHHTIAAKFDPDQTVSFTGTVAKVDWLNPHVHLFIDVAQGANVENWAVEMESPTLLEMAGWERDTVAIGDQLRVEGIRARDGSLQAWGLSVVDAGSGQAVLTWSEDSLPQPSDNNGPTPRWPDGQPMLGPPMGDSGYWGSPSRTVLVEDGSGVDVAADGLLASIADAGEVAPFQPWAKGVYEDRQQNFLAEDPLYLHCIPPAGPRAFQGPYGVQFVENRERERIFLLEGGGNRNFRIIYLDGREQIGDIRGDYDNPLFYGRSVAEWEGDTLVIDTIGFNERFWFSNGGLPHTSLLHMIERITREDYNTLTYEVTIDDPGAYTRQWTSTTTLDWIEGEMPVFYCQDNRP